MSDCMPAIRIAIASCFQRERGITFGGSADCGDEVALWLSQYILGSDKNIRLGYYLTTVVSRRKVVNTAISKRGYSDFRDKDLNRHNTQRSDR
uniref:Uncharacterized protein n=1 Tax=Timema monikensis TaxID=170555 RepID=A0A7R9EJ52_9NEOP|nr:unnamed protein product [Timema monikensis]